MGILQTALKKVEASVAENEDHLEESQIQEEEARHGDQGQSDSSEEHDGDVMVEEPEESGLTRGQEAEPSMEVDVDDTPPLTSSGMSLSQLRRMRSHRRSHLSGWRDGQVTGLLS